MAIKYIDREGNAITQKDWKDKQATPSYATVQEYDNGVVRLTLKWIGKVDRPHDTYPEYWKLYVLLVKNYRPDGTLVNDPVDNDQYFPNEEKAVAAYQSFLLKWTACQADEAGEFMEADNTLTPPPPPDPNRPSTEAEEPELGGVGAW